MEADRGWLCRCGGVAVREVIITMLVLGFYGLTGLKSNRLAVPQANGFADCWTGLLFDFYPDLIIRTS